MLHMSLFREPNLALEDPNMVRHYSESHTEVTDKMGHSDQYEKTLGTDYEAEQVEAFDLSRQDKQNSLILF